MQSNRGRILFVEDEQALVDIYHDFFKKEGYDFLTTSDIGDAMIIAECEQPDIVLLDIIIPKPENTMAEQGYDFLKLIKENPKTKHIPVMAFTNLDTPEDRKKCREMGAAGYIFKRDCTPREVMEAVDMVIKKHGRKK
jgi:DNA-binding response OmpR family regulator